MFAVVGHKAPHARAGTLAETAQPLINTSSSFRERISRGSSWEILWRLGRVEDYLSRFELVAPFCRNEYLTKKIGGLSSECHRLTEFSSITPLPLQLPDTIMQPLAAASKCSVSSFSFD